MNTVRDSPGEFSLLLEEEAVLGGVMAQLAASLLIQRFPWLLHLKEQFLIADGSRPFKDAVPSMSPLLWSFLILCRQPRSLSSVSGHPAC